MYLPSRLATKSDSHRFGARGSSSSAPGKRQPSLSEAFSGGQLTTQAQQLRQRWFVSRREGLR